MPTTNANSFAPRLQMRPPWRVRLASYVRRLRRHLLKQELDDFDWATYHQSYGPENDAERKDWTYDLNAIDYRVVGGVLFTIADAKPLHPVHRALYETLITLPQVKSVHEIGTGGGKLIVNARRIMPEVARAGASDLGEGQLALFERVYPSEYRDIQPVTHDITIEPLPETLRADVVFTATVLMHIKRKEAYRRALANLLSSGKSYVVLVEHWPSHQFVEDIRQIEADHGLGSNIRLWMYDSGSAIALIVSLRSQSMPDTFQELNHDGQLRKYH